MPHLSALVPQVPLPQPSKESNWMKADPEHHRMSTKGTAVEFTLRVFALGMTAAAAFILGFAKQSSNFGTVTFHASYKSSPAFRYFVGGNGAAALYTLLSLPYVFIKETGIVMHVLDLMTTTLVISAASAATAIGYVGKNGNTKIGWPQVCDYFERFCNTTEVSFACSYVGFALLLVACSLSLARRSSIDGGANF